MMDEENKLLRDFCSDHPIDDTLPEKDSDFSKKVA
jgi:hypothetical protein